MKYILVGNPNVGKTTLFNKMTNSMNKVTNFSGTTVDIYQRKIRSLQDELIDLPGMRSLIPHSEDEIVAVRYILEKDYQQIINILDSNNLKRNLQLSIQLLEVNKPCIFILNMQDELLASGRKLDIEKFASYFGASILTTAKENEEVEKIIDLITQEKAEFQFKLDYGQPLESAIEKIQIQLVNNNLFASLPSRFVALQILANNKLLFEQLPDMVKTVVSDILVETNNYIVEHELAVSTSGLIFKIRRNFIQEVLDACLEEEIVEPQIPKAKNFLDKVLLHPVGGIISFFLIFYLIYYFTFLLGDPMSEFLETYPLAIGQDLLTQLLIFLHIPEFFIQLLVDGAYAGFATVVMFLPQIILVFLFLTLLEGTGYMSRAVVVFDKFFSKFGLNGRALAPMMVGLGCNVPAIMAARTITDKKERMITQLIIPFISCAARLEIYIFFIGLFFDSHQAIILLSLNILGVLTALVSAKIFSLSLFKKTDNFFLLELPPYRTIRLTYIYKITMNKIKQFILNAGKFIVIGSIIMWLLLVIGPYGITDDINQSFFALIGHWFSWLFVPLGFGSWQATSSLITGFLAKELVVAQIGVLLADFPTISAGIHTIFTAAGAVSFMVFNLLYIPCLSTLAVIKEETKSWKWTLFSIGYSVLVAYIISFIIYHICLLFM